ncbi:MAG: fatty acid desaturase [Bdellovibrionota bacterium]
MQREHIQQTTSDPSRRLDCCNIFINDSPDGCCCNFLHDLYPFFLVDRSVNPNLLGLLSDIDYRRLSPPLLSFNVQSPPMVGTFYLIFGASAVQNSALKWSIDHRRHHAVTDQEDDPYSVKKGFWWSHFIWVLFKTPHSQNIKATDLKNNPRVMWQYRNYVPLLVTTTFIIPPLLGWIWGDPLGALLWVAGLRLVFLYHSTWCINSLAHTIGSRPYSKNHRKRFGHNCHFCPR